MPDAEVRMTESQTLPMRKSTRERRSLRSILAHSNAAHSAISLVVGLALWEIVGRFFITDRIFFVPFSEAAEAVDEGFAHGPLLHDLRVSLTELVAGYFAAVVLGVAAGVIMGLLPTVRSYLIFWVDVFNATPILALAPIFILMLGIGIESKIVFVAFVAIWSILLNTMTGFQYPDAAELEMAHSFGASAWQKFIYVRIPEAIPSVATGLRIGVGHAVVGIVVGELFGSSAGLGYQLFASKDQFDIAGIFAAVMVLALLALVAVRLMGMLERHLSRWRT
jgi:NitT/TauT family transport system permease protein